MLTTGVSYAMILCAAEGQRPARYPDRVTIDSIRNHTARHFPVQNVAKATYRASWSGGRRRTASTSSRAWPEE